MVFDENSIAERVLSGNESAFERLVDLYIGRVYVYSLYYLGMEKDAEQAVVETFCLVYRRLDTVKDDQLLTWVMRIAAEVCAERQRHRRGAAGRISNEETEDEEALDNEIRQQLVMLQRQQREVLLLHDVCGLEDEKTAKILKLEINGVRLRLSRARKNLRDQLLRGGALEKRSHRQRAPQKECLRYRELCSQYVDEMITDAEKAELLNHIQECEMCASFLNDLTLIGRRLSHMEGRKPPKELRERILEAAKQQEKQVKRHWKSARVPFVVFAAAMIAALVLIASGAIGGFFINSSGAEDAYAVGLNPAEEYVLREELNIPNNVTANSYAFVIAASGETNMPELSDSADILASDKDAGVTYYSVNKEINQVKKLTDGLQSVGYHLEAVNNRQLVISGSANQGLLIIIQRTFEEDFEQTENKETGSFAGK